MIEKHHLQWVIEQHYRTIDRHYNQRITTKSWCLTLWLIALGFTAINETMLLNWQGLVLTLLPVLMFWILEATQASHMKIMELRVAELEKLWLTDQSQIKKPQDLLFYGSHQYQSSKVKLNMFFFALFKMETVFSFYLLLAVLDVIAIVILMLTFPV